MRVDPYKPTEEARLLNLAMKLILIAAIASIVGTFIIFACTALWCEPVTADEYVSVHLSSPEDFGTGQWKITVILVSEAKSLDSFKAILLKNGTVEDVMDPLVIRLSANMLFFDLTEDGKLTDGDFLMIECDQGSNYELSIIWRNSGNEKGKVQWQS